jgi:hypothetical protein
MPTQTNHKGLECLNCGQPLHGDENFCPHCGQHNDTRKISIKEIVLHFFGGFFAFDNLFVKTLIPLLTKPGKVSKEFINGRRKSYTNPFIFLLHSAIVFIIINSLVQLLEISKKQDLKSEQLQHQLKVNIENFFSVNQNVQTLKDSSVAKIEKEKLLHGLLSQNMRLVDSIEKDYARDKEAVRFNIGGSYAFQKNTSKKMKDYQIQYEMNLSGSDSLYLTEIIPFQLDLKNGKWENMYNFANHDSEKPTLEVLEALHLKPSSWNVFVYEKIKDVVSFGDSIDEKAGVLWDKMLGKLPMSLFIVLPFFTLILSLLYIRHPYSYTEHLIFVFNNQSVVFWLMLMLVISEAIFGENSWINNLFRLGFFIYIHYYMYKALQYFYGQSRVKTLLKYVILSTAYVGFVLLGFAVLLVFAFLT